MLRNNAALKVTALLLAVFLWFYRLITAENPVAEKRLQVAVALEKMPAHLAVVQIPGPAEVVVRGPEDGLDAAGKQVRAWVNLEGASVGRQSYLVRVTLPDELTLVRRRPDRLSLQLEPVSTASLPVEYYLVGTVPSGYAVGEPRLQPSEVEVLGAARAVERVAHAVVSVNVGYARIGITRSDEVTAVDAQGNPVAGVTVEPAKVQVRVPVTRTRAYETVPVVLRTKGRVAAGYRIAGVELKPRVVTISGAASEIRRVAYVETEPLDLNGAAGPISRAVRLVAPGGVATLGARQVSVEVDVVREE
jgi:YbbR domain-containing protein